MWFNVAAFWKIDCKLSINRVFYFLKNATCIYDKEMTVVKIKFEEKNVDDCEIGYAKCLNGNSHLS